MSAITSARPANLFRPNEPVITKPPRRRDDLGPLAGETKRGIQFERIVRTAQALHGLRYGLTLEAVNRAVGDSTGCDWCLRTTRRDLALLFYLGVIANEGDRYRWSRAGGLFDMPAREIGVAADLASRDQNAWYFDGEDEEGPAAGYDPGH